MPPQHSYARIERERRFLLSQFPRNVNVVRIHRLTDFYISSNGAESRGPWNEAPTFEYVADPLKEKAKRA